VSFPTTGFLRNPYFRVSQATIFLIEAVAKEFAMNAIRSFALAATVSLGAALPAPAMTVADLASRSAPVAAPSAFLFAEPVVTGGAGRVDAQAARSAAEDYFNYDALVTLGALALAGGAMSAFAAFAAKRRQAEKADFGDGNWRDSVFAAIQADLAQFTESFRRAA
jgi:hypothetical protein